MNIRQFLHGRPHVVVPIEDPAEPFARFWYEIGACGNLPAALAALGRVCHRGPR